MTQENFETSFAANKRLVKNHTSNRVTEDAARELRQYLEKTVVPSLIQNAVHAADHANRKTIMASDIRAAIRQQNK